MPSNGATMRSRAAVARASASLACATCRFAALSSTERWLMKFCATSSWLRLWLACAIDSSACGLLHLGQRQLVVQLHQQLAAAHPLAVAEIELRHPAADLGPQHHALARPQAAHGLGVVGQRDHFDPGHFDRRGPRRAAGRRSRERLGLSRRLRWCRLFWYHQAAPGGGGDADGGDHGVDCFRCHEESESPSGECSGIWVASKPTCQCSSRRRAAAFAPALSPRRPVGCPAACLPRSLHRAPADGPAPLRRPGWPARRRARCRGRRRARAPSATRSRGRRRVTSSSSACQSSTFFTGCLAAVRQPLAFQPGSHSVMPLSTYWLSTCSVTAQGRLSACSAWITAISSMRLLVVRRSPPNSSFSVPPDLSSTPQPPGPGLPLQAPSV